MIGNSKVHHGVPADALVKLKPHKLGRHYHKVPQFISEAANKYPRLIGDYFLRNFRINLELQGVSVSEQIASEPDCLFRSELGKIGFSISRPLLAEALECYYGGTTLPSHEATPISTSEQRMRDRLGRDIAEIFGRVIMAGTSLGQLEAHDNAYDQPLWEYLVEFSLTSHLTSTTASLFIYLDNQLADLLTSKMALPGRSQPAGDPLSNIKRLPVRLECVLASVQMSLADVLALQPDDILMIRMHERCDVRINQQKLFRGAIFEDDGALCLTSLESVKSP